MDGRSGDYWRHNHVVVMKKAIPRDNNKKAEGADACFRKQKLKSADISGNA